MVLLIVSHALNFRRLSPRVIVFFLITTRNLSLLVETSCDGRTWTKLEQWDAPNEEYLGMDVEGEEEPPHCVQVAVSTGNEHIAK